MRLAVFTNRFPLRVAAFVCRDMHALIKAGVEVHLFPVYPYEPDLWQHIPEELQRVLPRDHVHHITPAMIMKSMSWSQLRGLPRFVRETIGLSVSAAREGVGPVAKSMYVVPMAWAWAHHFGDKFDQVFAFWGNYAATYAYLGHRLAGRPTPFTLHLHAGADLYLNKVYLRPKMLYSDNIMTVCKFNQRYIQEHFSDIYPRIEHKLHVNYWGLDLKEFPYQPNHRSPRRILAVGRFVDTKGFDYLLRATAELIVRGVDVELELIGDGDEGEALRALAAELRLGNRINFRGWLPNAEVRTAMAQAAIFVHPSSTLGDAKPNVIEEAMALGTPVVGTRISGIPELLDEGRCGIVVPPRDVAAMADAIQALLADPARRLAIAERGRQHVEATLDMWANGVALANHLRALSRPGAGSRP